MVSSVYFFIIFFLCVCVCVCQILFICVFVFDASFFVFTYNIQYNNSVGSSSHMNGLTKGKGSFELHPMLVVLGGWWIDSCRMINNEKEVIVEINDDYFDEINSHNKYINEFDDLIDTPLTLLIYDHFIIQHRECTNIHGIITNYKHPPS